MLFGEVGRQVRTVTAGARCVTVYTLRFILAALEFVGLFIVRRGSGVDYGDES